MLYIKFAYEIFTSYFCFHTKHIIKAKIYLVLFCSQLDKSLWWLIFSSLNTQCHLFKLLIMLICYALNGTKQKKILAKHKRVYHSLWAMKVVTCILIVLIVVMNRIVSTNCKQQIMLFVIVFSKISDQGYQTCQLDQLRSVS